MAVNRRDAMLLGATAVASALPMSLDRTSAHAAAGGGFISLRPALFASATGGASFRAQRYKAGL